MLPNASPAPVLPLRVPEADPVGFVTSQIGWFLGSPEVMAPLHERFAGCLGELVRPRIRKHLRSSDRGKVPAAPIGLGLMWLKIFK